LPPALNPAAIQDEPLLRRSIVALARQNDILAAKLALKL